MSEFADGAKYAGRKWLKSAESLGLFIFAMILNRGQAIRVRYLIQQSCLNSQVVQGTSNAFHPFFGGGQIVK